MKILIISNYFPPLNRMASSRPAAWAQHWSEAGHNITVLTNKKHAYHGPLSLPCPEFNTQVSLVEVDYVLAGKFGYGGKKSWRRLLYGWQRLCWIFQAAFRVIGLARANDFDVIVSTYSPPSPIFLGLIAKLCRPKCKWVVDFRDLWTGNPYKSRKRVVEQMLKWLQRRLLSRADFITTVSPPLQTELCKLMPKLDVSVIYNGHDGISERLGSSLPNDIIQILYSGIIYPGKRDPKPLFRALQSLADAKEIDTCQFELCFLGDKLADLPSMLREFGLDHIAKLPGQVSRKAAVEAQRKASLLVLLGGDDPGVLPGKLFEYIAACRPVLAIGDSQQSDVGQLLQRTGCGLAVGFNEQAISEIIRCLANGKPLSFFRPDMYEVDQCSRRKQSAKLETELLQLMNSSTI